MGWPGFMTNRQLVAWNAHLDAEETRSKLTDEHIKQVAAEVRKTRAKHPESVKRSDFDLQPKGTRRKKEWTVEELSRLGKLAGAARSGLAMPIRRPTRGTG